MGAGKSSVINALRGPERSGGRMGKRWGWSLGSFGVVEHKHEYKVLRFAFYEMVCVCFVFMKIECPSMKDGEVFVKQILYAACICAICCVCSLFL